MKGKITFLNVVFFLMFLMSLTGIAYGHEREKMIAQFDRFDFAINSGQGHSKKTNEANVLSWAESYLLEAYLVMYEATGNKKYIEKFVSQAEDVYNTTDKQRGIKDYTGRMRSGWGTTKGSKGKVSVVTILGTGMIAHPLVKFAALVKERKELADYRGVAGKYVGLAEEAVAEFNDQWWVDRVSGQGYYRMRGDEPNKAVRNAAIAFNGTMGIGRVLILLYQVTGKNEYLIKSKALALTLRNNLSLGKNNSYVWGYRPGKGRLEDISHGAIDVEFVTEAAKNDIVFTRNDLERFANTLLNTYQGKNNRFSVFVDGSDDRKGSDFSNAAARWLDLCTVNCNVYRVVYKYNSAKLQNSQREHPGVMLGLAKMIKYHGLCPVT